MSQARFTLKQNGVLEIRNHLSLNNGILEVVDDSLYLNNNKSHLFESYNSLDLYNIL